MTSTLPANLRKQHTPVLRAEFARFLADCKPPRHRTMREFAEQELVIPEGKYQGQKWRAYRQPFAALLLDEMDSGQWSRFAITGCVQSGKSLIGFVLPCLYHLFELQENVILAAPNMDTARDKWSVEIAPALRASRFASLLPVKGRGSKAGFAESITFGNGVTIKFMSAGGGDEKKSSFTSRVVVMTEVDKMDEAGEASREANAVQQLEARALSYDITERRIYLECTVSIEQGRIWQEYTHGSGGRLAVPCVHCGAYVTPEREHLVGYDDVENEVQAGLMAAFSCPECGELWSDKQRKEMQRELVIAHRGQEITPEGEVTGKLPETRTLGFRWNAFNNLFWSKEAIGTAAYRARDSEDEDDEKEQCQFYWTTPYEPPALDETNLDARVLRKRVDEFPPGRLPADTEFLTMGVDLGKWHSWWFLIAWRKNRTLHVPAYGSLEVVTDEAQDVEIELLRCLREFHEVIELGWPIDGSAENRIPDAVWIDAGYLPGVVYQFIREVGENRYRAVIGQGESIMKRTKYTHPTKKTTDVREVGRSGNWHTRIVRAEKVPRTTINADFWKRYVQERLSTRFGEPGCMRFYGAPPKEHRVVTKHLTNERYRQVFKEGKGYVGEWEKVGANHYLDGAAYASAAGDYVGFSLTERDESGAKPKQKNIVGGWFANRRSRKR